MSVLVIGGCGFIGSHLVEELLARGKEVQVIGLKCHLENLAHLAPRFEFLRVDIADRDAVFHALDPSLEAVFHLAALVNVDQSLQNPGPFFAVNCQGTFNILEAVRRKGIPRLVYMSTCEIYGLIPSGKAPETHATDPRSPYAASKLAAEGFVLGYAHSFASPRTTIIRGFNQYGPRQGAGDAGAVIPRFATRLLQGQRIEVYGDGLQTRDYVFVKDTVRGIIDAFESELPSGEIVNLATGEEHTILDIARRLCRLTGKDESYIKFVPARPGELRRSCGDYAKAKKLLGWEPQTTFAEGLELTFRSYLPLVSRA